jgi:putative PIG3 family NAD(P)H quinone oxidoreductase
MYAVTLSDFGGPEVLGIGDVPTPIPGSGEVRIKVAAAGVNRADILQRRGFYPPPPGITDILGLEASGVVDLVGEGVTNWHPGDEVVALLAGGGYGEYVVVPSGQCAPLPPRLDIEEAAGVIEAAATALSNMRHVHLRSGETLLVHGGAGGIGSVLIPYAKSLGVRVITTVGSAQKAAYCRSIGADEAVDYRTDWAEDVRNITDGIGVDVILDIIGAKYLEANLSVLARGGRLVIIGLQGGRKATLDINKVLTKGATITATSLRFRPEKEKADIVSDVVDTLWPLFDSGDIPLPPQKVFTLKNVALAHEYLDSGRNIGKVVLRAR